MVPSRSRLSAVLYVNVLLNFDSFGPDQETPLGALDGVFERMIRMLNWDHLDRISLQKVQELADSRTRPKGALISWPLIAIPHPKQIAKNLVSTALVCCHFPGSSNKND